MVCTRENAPGVKEASVLNLSSFSDDLPKPDSSTSGAVSRHTYILNEWKHTPEVPKDSLSALEQRWIHVVC